MFRPLMWSSSGRCVTKNKYIEMLQKLREPMHMQGRAMAQAVCLRPLTAEARVRLRVSPCGICGGKSGTGTGYSPSTSVLPCQFHSTGAPLHGKTEKISFFIIGLHKNP
jgi:hypothetical protein